MFDFLNIKFEAFGLDISDLSLKIIKLKKKGNFLKLCSFGESAIKPGLITGGEIKNEKELAKTIKTSLDSVRGEKLMTKYVVASLPEEKSFLQVIQLPKMKPEELAKAVYFEAENYIPLPIDQVYLDFQIINPLNENIDHLDILIAVLPKKIVDQYLFCLKLAGLIPIAFEIESQAIARALVANEISSTPLLLIDLGANRTSFVIFSGTSLEFTSSLPISSKNFTDAIANNLKISQDEAEKLKHKYGLEDKIELKINGKSKPSDEHGEIFESLVPVLTDLSEQIKKYLDYYQSHSLHGRLTAGKKNVAKVLISGGGANLRGLAGFLSSELRLPVELANPWINILSKDKKESAGLSLKDSLSFCTAIGLALRGVRQNKSILND